MSHAPVLPYPTREGAFVLDTDASNTGIGAVLSQKQGGEERVTAYLSRSLKKSENTKSGNQNQKKKISIISTFMYTKQKFGFVQLVDKG